MDLPEKQKPLSHDDLHKVIKHFTNQQLTEIVATASLRHADVLEAVRSIADQDTGNRWLSITSLSNETTLRLSITSLSNETTSQKLRQIFATYGDLELSQTYVRTTPTVKGSGYVTYKHIDGALRALKKRLKLIDGKLTVTQLASSRFEVVNSNQKSSTSFGGGGSNGVYGYGGSVGGLGGGKFGYGGVRQGPSVRLSQPLPLNSSRLPSYCGDSDDFDSDDFDGDDFNSEDSDSDDYGVSAYSGGLGLPCRPATAAKLHVPGSYDRVKRMKQAVADTYVHISGSGDMVKLEVKQEVVHTEVHGPRSGDVVKREVIKQEDQVHTNQKSEAMRMSSGGYYNLSSDSDD